MLGFFCMEIVCIFRSSERICIFCVEIGNYNENGKWAFGRKIRMKVRGDEIESTQKSS